ncbi:MAG: GNAT family N-acetyltransferase [Flavobacteriaceae bacterium]|nr:GNAT family N-acetyltransferase [Flavobacteriaceae bacterium]
MTIIPATIDHLNDLIPLFDGYRIFYRQKSNPKAAKEFLYKRLTKNDTIIYIAYIDKKAVGFTHLFPSFSSVSMEPLYILNDLFVDTQYRNQGIGGALLNKAKELCKEKNYKGLALQTEKSNPAQYLYESMGWEREKYLQYFWNIDS